MSDNHYLAFIDGDGNARITKPRLDMVEGLGIDMHTGHIRGFVGVSTHLNGWPPVWCTAIVEVHSPNKWKQLTDEEKRPIWTRGAKDMRPATINFTVPRSVDLTSERLAHIKSLLLDALEERYKRDGQFSDSLDNEERVLCEALLAESS